MSHVYSISAGNPEGFDWVLDLAHDEGFTQEQFQQMVEDAIWEVWDEDIKADGVAHQSSIDTERLRQKMFRHGFRGACRPTAHYDFEPYWGKDRIGKRLQDKMDEMDALAKAKMDADIEQLKAEGKL